MIKGCLIYCYMGKFLKKVFISGRCAYCSEYRCGTRSPVRSTNMCKLISSISVIDYGGGDQFWYFPSTWYCLHKGTGICCVLALLHEQTFNLITANSSCSVAIWKHFYVFQKYAFSTRNVWYLSIPICYSINPRNWGGGGWTIHETHQLKIS